MRERQRRALLRSRLLAAAGRWQARDGSTHLIARRLVDVTPWLGSLATSSRVFIESCGRQPDASNACNSRFDNPAERPTGPRSTTSATARSRPRCTAWFSSTPWAKMPQFVKGEFDAFLECGILAHGFLRLRCGDCGHDDDRRSLEQLCRYVTRPALANELVQTNAAGQMVLRLKTP